MWERRGNGRGEAEGGMGEESEGSLVYALHTMGKGGKGGERRVVGSGRKY